MILVSSDDMVAELRTLSLNVECSDLFSSDVVNLTEIYLCAHFPLMISYYNIKVNENRVNVTTKKKCQIHKLIFFQSFLSIALFGLHCNYSQYKISDKYNL